MCHLLSSIAQSNPPRRCKTWPHPPAPEGWQPPLALAGFCKVPFRFLRPGSGTAMNRAVRVVQQHSAYPLLSRHLCSYCAYQCVFHVLMRLRGVENSHESSFPFVSFVSRQRAHHSVQMFFFSGLQQGLGIGLQVTRCMLSQETIQKHRVYVGRGYFGFSQREQEIRVIQKRVFRPPILFKSLRHHGNSPPGKHPAYKGCKRCCIRFSGLVGLVPPPPNTRD